MQKVNCSGCGEKTDCLENGCTAEEHFCSECTKYLTRTCPECEQPELEITAGLNMFECNFCGAIWHRIKPQMTINGKMIKIPKKLQNLLKKNEEK